MEIVDHDIEKRWLPADAIERYIESEKRQPYTIFTPRGMYITRWRLTPQERQRIAQGEDLFLSVQVAVPTAEDVAAALPGLAPFTGLKSCGLSVGPRDWRQT